MQSIDVLGKENFANTKMIMEIKEYQDGWHRAVLNHILMTDEKQMDRPGQEDGRAQRFPVAFHQPAASRRG